MARCSEIVAFCEQYLRVRDFDDYCVNGLQVEGSVSVERVVTGVSLSKRLIEEAVKRRCQMLIVHHGLFSSDVGKPPALRGVVARRLRLLLANDLNLCGFHLPLDAHPRIGNNISLCRLLGISKTKPLNVGFIGELQRPMSFERWRALVDRKLGVKSSAVCGGAQRVKRVAVISGGSSPDYAAVAGAGADTFLCGDLRENVVRAVEEAGLNLLNAGHYNSEKLGVQNLGRLIARRFRVKVEYIDIPNEI